MKLYNTVKGWCQNNITRENFIKFICIPALAYTLGYYNGKNSHSTQDLNSNQGSSVVATKFTDTTNHSAKKICDTLQTTHSTERTLQKDKEFSKQDIDTLCKDINTIITQAKSPLKIINIPQGDDEIILTIRSYPSKKELDLKREDLDNEYHIIFHGGKLFEREMRGKNGGEPYAGFELDSAYPKFCKNSPNGVYIQTPTADETKVVLKQQNKLLYKLQELLKIYKTTHLYFH